MKQKIYLCRHGETEWSKSGQHTSFTDLPLTEEGEREAKALKHRLQGVSPALVLTSPLQRAQKTCHLAGFEGVVCPEAIEWQYGEYEGITTAEIHKTRPGWSIFNDGVPGGESARDVGKRADLVIAQMIKATGDVILFAHGHFLRVFVARWIGLDPAYGKAFGLGTAALSIVGYVRDERAIFLWNHTPSEQVAETRLC